MEKNLKFSDDRLKEAENAIAGYERETGARSFRQFVFDLYPAITEALRKGATRKEIYERFLTKEERKEYTFATFTGYYYQARKLAEKSGR